MPDEELKDQNPAGDAGYPDTGPADGAQTTDAGPSDQSDGQSGDTQESTTQQGPADEDTFFDPKEIADRPELMAGYKQMQAAYTKKMQAVADQRHKIEAFDAFYANPIEQIQRVAQQYGMQLTPAQAANIAQQQSNQQQAEDWNPQNWGEVQDRLTQAAVRTVLEQLSPVLGQVQDMRKQTIEQTLTEIDPTWQQYEDQMKANLQNHPTLSNDPGMLYRLSVPEHVLESRATQAALKKLENKQQSAQISTTSTTNKSPRQGLPDKAVSFQDAVKAAKSKLAEEGIRPGG